MKGIKPSSLSNGMSMFLCTRKCTDIYVCVCARVCVCVILLFSQYGKVNESECTHRTLNRCVLFAVYFCIRMSVQNEVELN